MARCAPAIQVVIELADIDPPVWRRVILSRSMTLHELHRTIQLLFGWYDYHLYEFSFGDRRFQAPDPEADAEDATLTTLADLNLRGGATLHYTYDFGDEWVHVIAIETMRVRTNEGQVPWLLEGERSGPPEDCGGAVRYMELLDALTKPLEDLDDSARELVDWVHRDFDPAAFNIEQTRNALILSSKWGLLSETSN